jgi:YidC/Oxa1 family membrane protein insertase
VDRNLFLAFALSFAVLAVWMLVASPPPRPQPGAVAEEASPRGTALPAAPPVEGVPQLPALEPAEARPPEAGELALPEAAPPPGRQVVLDSQLFRATFDSVGAGLRHWELKEYDTGERNGARPIVLTTGRDPFPTALVTRFEELGIGDLSKVAFNLAQPDPRTLVFEHVADGITVRKTYVFPEGGYDFALRIAVENESGATIAPRYELSWPAHEQEGEDFREQGLAVLHDGSLEQTPLQSLGKAGFFGGSPEKVSVFPREIDWAGVQETYFVAAMLPDDPGQASGRKIATRPGEAGVVQIFFDPVQIPTGKSHERIFRVYAGPKEPERLEAIGSGLVRAIDLGWSWLVPLTRAFNWLLAALYSVIPNYGLAIIVLTILVRAVTTPLTVRQMRSMERMRALAPKIQELKEKFPDDRQKQSEEMMKLYRREGVNPLGGCLPMLLQLPVFIGLFYALRSSIQLRQAPFVGWIHDLSSPEALFVIPGIEIPVRVLPLVMGATMVVQQKLTPMQVDPAQARMMMTVMPIMMTVLFYQFPSGLVLYWMVSNVLAIAHQLWIGRSMRAGAG